MAPLKIMDGIIVYLSSNDGIWYCVIKDLKNKRYDDDDITLTYDVCNDCLKAQLILCTKKYICVVCCVLCVHPMHHYKDEIFLNNDFLSDFILKNGNKCWMNKIPNNNIGVNFDVCDKCYYE